MKKIIMPFTLIILILFSSNIAFSEFSDIDISVINPDGNGLLYGCNSFINEPKKDIESPNFDIELLKSFFGIGKCSSLIKGIRDLNIRYEYFLKIYSITLNRYFVFQMLLLSNSLSKLLSNT
jgi:hypothetical protein